MMSRHYHPFERLLDLAVCGTWDVDTPASRTCRDDLATCNGSIGGKVNEKKPLETPRSTKRTPKQLPATLGRSPLSAFSRGSELPRASRTFFVLPRTPAETPARYDLGWSHRDLPANHSSVFVLTLYIPFSGMALQFSPRNESMFNPWESSNTSRVVGC